MPLRRKKEGTATGDPRWPLASLSFSPETFIRWSHGSHGTLETELNRLPLLPPRQSRKPDTSKWLKCIVLSLTLKIL